MLGGDRVRNVAALGFLIAAIFAFPVSGQENHPEQKAKAAETENTGPNTPSANAPRSPEDKQPETNWGQPNCENPNTQPEADLCQQRRMAKAAEDTVFLNQIQTGIGVVGGLLLLATLVANVVGTFAAKTAAQANRDSADIQVSIETPRLRILNVSLANPGDGVGRFRPMDVLITVQNFGRTPAFVTDWLVQAHVVSDALPEEPTFSGLARIESDLQMPVIGNDPVMLRQHDDHFRLRDEQIERVLKFEDFLIFTGIIIFEDFLGHKYERGFAVRWEPPTGSHPECCATWDQPGYNYQEKLKPEHAKNLPSRA